MANLLVDSRKKRTYDAIVIGSGASGGWAAKEFCDKGLKTLVLERGRNVEHVKDYPTASKAPWEFDHRGTVSIEQRKDLQGARNLREETLLWARQTQRWSDFDFEGPARDSFAVDWPIRYKDIEEWYSYVEKFAGIAGNRDGLPELPDSIVMPAFETSAIENYFKENLQKNFTDRHLIAARCAHITDPQQIHVEQGRSKCQNQTMCNRGCIFGAYFSSNASTIPWALKTGNLTIRPHSVVHSIMYDD